MKKILSMFALIGCFQASQAWAFDGISLTAGSGSEADMANIALHWNWDKRWFAEGDWFLSGYWELGASFWKGNGPSPRKEIYGIGFTPVFRFERQPINGIAPYIEGGIGINQFSGKQVNGDTSMGSRFEFSDHIGLGLKFGERQQYDLSYRFQHYSNAGITSENPGINFNQIRLTYHF
ncbi:acyloxyacyl hydrolase [Methylobacillus arboreus]|uniref:acyloxyacyl hydrolase n=1 Tax=Methylobacillus arboreus TaxID=755170 RepID=UPI001E2FD8AE|nr:acyloxyacyl hydrolase [Methylobacillus arboreus]MCB5189853.1 acyloxyacyl hydrolase [Methylobacillus arboreus]